MRFPNKITSLNESVIGKGIFVLVILSKGDQSVADLYQKIKKMFSSFFEYISTLDYLFAIGKVSLKEGGLLCYVK